MPITRDELKELVGSALPKKGLLETFANLYPLPDLRALPIKPLSQQHREADSAAVLVSNLAARVDAWTRELPSDVQVAIYAMLMSGEQIRVSDMTAEGQNGIVIKSPDGYMALIHQSNLQILCVGEKIEDQSKRRTIGFNPGTLQTQEDPE